MSCLTYGNDAAVAVAYNDRMLVVGLSSTKDLLYNRTTYQNIGTYHRGESVEIVTFSLSGKSLASSGLKLIHV